MSSFAFKLVREHDGIHEWEMLPKDKNHVADLTNHCAVRILVKEGETHIDIVV